MTYDFVFVVQIRCYYWCYSKYSYYLCYYLCYFYFIHVTPQKSKAMKKVIFPYSKIWSQQKLELILNCVHSVHA
jgi:hypothetical protein